MNTIAPPTFAGHGIDGVWGKERSAWN